MPVPTSVRVQRRLGVVALLVGSMLALGNVVHAQGGTAGQIPAAVAEQGVECTITIPAHALTAQGLASPWELGGRNRRGCDETVKGDAAFVDATIFDPATGELSIYRPLVVTAGTRPAVDPQAPTLPAGAVVEISVGFNGDELTLRDRNGGRDIAEAHCVNGLPGSIFGQEIFCNAPELFAAAGGKVAFPARGDSPADGRPCPTTESWEIVDQDQSDNTTTNYLVVGDRTAQNTAANQAQVGGAVIGNGSDNNLYTRFYAPAVGCQPPQATDVTDPDHPVRSTTSAMLSMFARSVNDPLPALIPLGDPFTQFHGRPSLSKTNLYRQQVDQPPAATREEASTATYCRNLLNVGLTKIELDKPFLEAFGSSPDPGVSNDLHLFILARFMESWDNLSCERQTGIPNPVTVRTDADGQVIDARVHLPTDTSTTSTAAPTTTIAPTSTTEPATTEPTSTNEPTSTTDPTTTTEPTTEPPTSTAVSRTTAPTVADPASSTTAAMAARPSSGPGGPTAQPPDQPEAVLLAPDRQPLAGTRRGAGASARDAASGYAVGPELPFTGSDSRLLLALAGALLLGGSALVLRASVLDQRQRS
jgi:hypothetical protein